MKRKRSIAFYVWLALSVVVLAFGFYFLSWRPPPQHDAGGEWAFAELGSHVIGKLLLLTGGMSLLLLVAVTKYPRPK